MTSFPEIYLCLCLCLGHSPGQTFQYNGQLAMMESSPLTFFNMAKTWTNFQNSSTPSTISIIDPQKYLKPLLKHTFYPHTKIHGLSRYCVLFSFSSYRTIFIHFSHYQQFSAMLAIISHSSQFQAFSGIVCHFQQFKTFPATFRQFQSFPAITSLSSHFKSFPAILAISSNFQQFQLIPVMPSHSSPFHQFP